MRPRDLNLGLKRGTKTTVNTCVENMRTPCYTQIPCPITFLFKEERILATHPPSCHPRRVFGYPENERKGEKVRPFTNPLYKIPKKKTKNKIYYKGQIGKKQKNVTKRSKCQKVGNVSNAGGKAFTACEILQVFATCEISQPEKFCSSQPYKIPECSIFFHFLLFLPSGILFATMISTRVLRV